MTTPAAILLTLVLTTAASLAGLARVRRVQNRPAADSALLDLRSWHGMAAGRFIRLIETGHPVALLAVNLDRLAVVNHRHGHAAGDAVLDAVESVLLTHTGPAGLAARLSGDHFVLLLAADADLASQTAHAISQDIRAVPHRILKLDVPSVGRLTASIGVGVYPHDGRSVHELQVVADVLVFAAKNSGRNQVNLARTPPSTELQAS